jgi:hypothetical protein
MKIFTELRTPSGLHDRALVYDTETDKITGIIALQSGFEWHLGFPSGLPRGRIQQPPLPSTPNMLENTAFRADIENLLEELRAPDLNRSSEKFDYSKFRIE